MFENSYRRMNDKIKPDLELIEKTMNLVKQNKGRSKQVPTIVLASLVVILSTTVIAAKVTTGDWLGFLYNSKDTSQIAVSYATVTADNFSASYIFYSSAEEAIKAIPLIIKGEIIEVIKPFDREVVFAADSADKKIADKIGGSGRSVVQIAGYRIRVLDKYKGNLASKEIVVAYNIAIFDQPLPLAVGDTMIWTLDAIPAFSCNEFSTEQVYTFITPWLSAYYLAPNDRLVALCREADGGSLDQLPFHDLCEFVGIIK